ncbi:LysR family transcriptional regulator [Paenibacillus tianjinensis]|uniref:LysR family transcriptional regulator n=1 Tax=Paenibacillus tianjinensis TaxID=2810347 RepID=UPI001E30103A|nr:LysR family transcriptional regulator [Paenibacillus tianjinensis]
MELYQLKTFIKIAQTGNLTEAAAQLNTSQPAVSAHLKSLEKEVGFALFHRSSKGMTITEKGSQLIVEAQNILSSIDKFQLKVNELKENQVDHIRIGVNTEGHILRIAKLIKYISECLPVPI